MQAWAFLLVLSGSILLLTPETGAFPNVQATGPDSDGGAVANDNLTPETLHMKSSRTKRQAVMMFMGGSGGDGEKKICAGFCMSDSSCGQECKCMFYSIVWYFGWCKRK